MQEIIVVEFVDVGFSGKLRPSQVASSEIIREQLMAGEKNLHIVAPTRIRENRSWTLHMV